MIGVEGRPIRAVAVVSIVMLAACWLVRVAGPSPFARRVNVRWAEGISDAQRQALEPSLALVNGQRLDGRTWQYDLVDTSSSAVRALVENASVEDTHYIDRVGAVVNPDAAIGTARLLDPGVAGLVRSRFFDWFVSLWIASLVVSVAWMTRPVS